jgi:hypothetical protein
LFAISDSVAREVTGAETSELVSTGEASPTYISENFDFEDTLLASNTSYEMRLFVWYDSPTFLGFDDFGIKFKSCLPSAPTISEVTTTARSASVVFTAPSTDGGSAITNYQYSTDGGATWVTRSPAATTSPLSISGLTANSDLQIQLRAVTIAGNGAASDSTPASTSQNLRVSYNFNSTGELANNFNRTSGGGGTVSQSNTGGINNTGAISAPPGTSSNAVFTSKSSYSIGPEGSTYTFTSFMKSVGNSGYSGMGFTAESPTTSTQSSPYRPSDAIGISVHGGGFFFHNGTSNAEGNWSSANPGNGIVAVKPSSIGDLLNSGSPEQWYKVVFKIERAADNKFDTSVEVWPSDSQGTLLAPESPHAIFEWNGIENQSLLEATAIHSYINFSGHRVHFFDDYSVDLAGGATIAVGEAPTVVTESVVPGDSGLVVSGEVISDGGTDLLSQGFVFGSEPDPVVGADDPEVQVGPPGIGEFSAGVPALEAGQYYVRAFAENSGGLVSYGEPLAFTIENSCTPNSFDSSNYSYIGLPAGTYTPSLSEEGVVELTPATTTRAGAVWGTQRLNLENNFDIEAEIKISPNVGNSYRADGIAFVLQPSSSTNLTSGGGLGYGGITPSFAVEFDTYTNAPGDPNNNHIALMKDGNTTSHNAWGHNPYTPSLGTFNLENSSFTKVKFAWDADAKEFSFYLDINRDGTFEAGETIYDAVSLALDTHFSASDNFVYWGFTGATGGQYNSQSVKLSCSSFTARTNTPPVITAPTADLELQETRTLTIDLQDDSTTQAQWNLDVVSPTSDVSVDSVNVISSTQAEVTITGLAESSADLEVTAVDADGAETVATLSVTVESGSQRPPTDPEDPPTDPQDPPTDPQDPGDKDPEETENETPEKPVSPNLPVIPPPAPTPSPAPSGEGGAILMPVLKPTPNVVYGSTNPIPEVLRDALNAPLAFLLGLLSGLPELPKLSPTESLAYENGSPVTIQLIENGSNNGYVLIGDGWQVSLEATDSSGEPLLLDDDGNIILNSDRFVQFSGNGFAPGSIVKVWLFSTPTELSDVIADVNGNFIGKALIPEGIPTGEHTIQLNGLTKDGQLRSVALGVLIQPEVLIAPVPPVGFDLSGTMNFLWIILVLVSIWLFILWRRRKKKEEEGSPVASGDPTDLIFASERFKPSQ